MNILMFCYEYPPIGGGGGVGARQYAEAFARKGHRVRMVTSCAKGLARQEMVRGVEVIRLRAIGRKDRATATFVSMLAYNIGVLWYLMRCRKDLRKFEVVNTHFSIPTGPAAQLASRWLGRANVLTIIGGDIYDPSKRCSPHRQPVFRWMNRWIINGADRVVAISSDTKMRAERYYGITRRIEVINYGFAPECVEEEAGALEVDKGLEREWFDLVAMGRLVPRKGFEYLLEAITKLSANVRLRIIGDGPLHGALEKRVRELGLAGRAFVLGYQSRAKIDYYLKHSDVFVLSSLHEGLGIVVQEAMHAGLPVVATDNGGQVDLIKEGRNGLLVPIADADAIARAVRKLRDDPGLAASMGEHNRQDIAQLDIDVNCEGYLQLFAELAAGRVEAVGTTA